MISVSNTRIASSVPSTPVGKFKDTFEVTPPLSTYLIAIIVSKYERNNSTLEFGVYSRPAAKTATQFALDFGKTMLAKFGEYLGIDYYTLGKDTKMDMASIPDFSAGGKNSQDFSNDPQLTFRFIFTAMEVRHNRGMLSHGDNLKFHQFLFYFSLELGIVDVQGVKLFVLQ